MKSSVRIFLIAIMVVSSVPVSDAQKLRPEITEPVRDKESLSEIIREVSDNYKEEEQSEYEFESNQLKWERRLWFLSNHLGPGGKPVDVQKRNWKAAREAERMLAADQRDINSYWTTEGPSGSNVSGSASYNGLGRIDRIAFHPTDPDVIYLGAPAGGLWVTYDNAETWINLTDNIPSIAISGIVISHANPDDIYILTGDGDSFAYPGGAGLLTELGYVQNSAGILKSVDKGVTWLQTGELPSADPIMVGHQLVQDPINANTLLAATSSGLYRTTDGGDSWIREDVRLTYDVKFHPTNSNYAYASVENGLIIYSDDNGASWYTAANLNIDERISLSVSPAAPDNVYALAGGSPDSNYFNGFYKATAPVFDFELLTDSPNVFGKENDGNDSASKSKFIQALSIAASSESHVAVAGFTVWTSPDEGASWDNSSAFSESRAVDTIPYIHPDVHDVKYNPLNDHLFAATDGGIYRSEDYGETWEDISYGVTTTMFYHHTAWIGNSPKSLGGSQDNGIKYRTGNTPVWDHIAGADGFDIVFNPLNGEPGYGTANRSMMGFEENGANPYTINEPVNEWFMTIGLHNTNPDTVFLGASTIWRSYDGGDSWEGMPDTISGSWSFASCPSNNDRFYAAGGPSHAFSNANNSGLFVTSDLGETWERISDKPGFPADWNKITDIAVSPFSSSIVFVTFGGYTADQKVYISTDAGQEWFNLTSNLPNVPVYCIGVDTDNSLYIGTEIGVFYRGNTMSRWMSWSNDLPNIPVTGITVQNNYVQCGTFGRGAWRSPKAEGCVPTLQLVSEQEGRKHYETSDWIRSAVEIVGGAGTYVSLQAGSYIEFYPGVEVLTGNTLNVSLGPCGLGVVPLIWQPSENTAERSSYEPEQAYHLGWINRAKLVNNVVDINFNLRMEGKIELKLLYNGKEQTILTEQMTTGVYSRSIELPDAPDAFYHLVMYHNGRVAHYQELHLK